MVDIILIGGSGFLGGYLVKHLVKDGHSLKIYSRDLEKAKTLKTYGNPGQVVLVEGDVSNEALLSKHIEGMDIIINTVGILNESGNNNFYNLHVSAAQSIAQKATSYNVKQLIHVSALLNEDAQSKYAETKLLGEQKVRQDFPNATIIKPGLMFGKGSDFFNKISKLVSLLGVFPLFGGGANLLHPVYAGDVAELIRRVIAQKIQDKTYDVTGDETYSFNELVLLVAQELNKKCFFLKFSHSVSYVLAFILERSFSSLLSKVLTGSFAPIITRDQLKMLFADNVSTQDSILRAMGIQPTTIKEALPQILKHS